MSQSSLFLEGFQKNSKHSGKPKTNIVLKTQTSNKTLPLGCWIVVGGIDILGFAVSGLIVGAGSLLSPFIKEEQIIRVNNIAWFK